MKTKALLLLLAAFIINIGAFAQEDDDMYFNASDRAKLQSKEQKDQVAYEASVKKAKKMREEEPAAEDESVDALNPTDSYSARNVNPEYEARSTANLSQSDDQDYFVNNYQYSTSSNLNNWNNNFNSWYGNSWYTPNYYNSNINSWNSPYYGYADPSYSPWYNPYWNNGGWSASFSYYWGNSYNNYGNYGYGWGGNYNYWNRPYCGSSWGYGGYGYNSGYPGWYGYPGSVIIVNNGEGVYGPRYGKRGSRGNEVVNSTQRSSRGRTPVSDAFGNNNRSQRSVTTGRVASQNQNLNNNAVTPANNSRPARSQNTEYYNRSWRRVTQEPSNSGNSNSNSNTGRSSGRTSNSNSNSNWNNSNSNNDNSYTPPKNSNTNSNSSFGNSNSGGGGRSSGSSGSSSGGGGRSRGGRGN